MYKGTFEKTICLVILEHVVGEVVLVENWGKEIDLDPYNIQN